MTKALYDRATTRISVKSQSTKEIPIKRGVKQGCPMSPLYFNFCIDILLRWLEEENKEDGVYFEENNEGKGTKGYSFIGQAYADDVILMSPTHEGMENILRTVDEFCRWSKMKLAPQKCHCIHYAFEKGERIGNIEPFHIGYEEDGVTRGTIEIGKIDSTLEYLGINIGFWGRVRKRQMKDTINKLKSDCEKVMESPLTFSQKIDCLKKRILTQLDYALLNGNFSIKMLEEADRKIRDMIREDIKGKGIPTDYFYTSWRDGGLDLPNLTERYCLLQIRNLLKISSSPDERVRALERVQWEEECRKRKIIPVENSPYLEMPEKQVDDIKDDIDYGKGTQVDCLHVRAAKAVKKLRLSLRRERTEKGYKYYLKNKYKEEMMKKKGDEINEDKEKEEPEIEIDYKSFLKMAGKMVKDNHYTDLINENIKKGQTFIDIKDDIISNHFMRDEGQMMNNEEVKFAVLARTQSLYLPDKEKVDEKRRCFLCRGRSILTINHLLNSCLHRKKEYTERHNAVQAIFRQYLEQEIRGKDVTIRENSTITLDDRGLTGDEGNLKPDLWYIEGNKIVIVEFTIPFGQNTKRNGRGEEQEMRTLEKARKDKEEKYKTLVNKCQEELGLNTEYYIIVISSLGAMPEETLEELRKIFGTKKYKGIARMMVRKAIKESRKIYLHWLGRRDRIENEEEEEEGESSESEEENNHVNQREVREENSENYEGEEEEYDKDEEDESLEENIEIDKDENIRNKPDNGERAGELIGELRVELEEQLKKIEQEEQEEKERGRVKEGEGKINDGEGGINEKGEGINDGEGRINDDEGREKENIEDDIEEEGGDKEGEKDEKNIEDIRNIDNNDENDEENIYGAEDMDEDVYVEDDVDAFGVIEDIYIPEEGENPSDDSREESDNSL